MSPARAGVGGSASARSASSGDLSSCPSLRGVHGLRGFLRRYIRTAGRSRRGTPALPRAGPAHAPCDTTALLARRGRAHSRRRPAPLAPARPGPSGRCASRPPVTQTGTAPRRPASCRWKCPHSTTRASLPPRPPRGRARRATRPAPAQCPSARSVGGAAPRPTRLGRARPEQRAARRAAPGRSGRAPCPGPGCPGSRSGSPPHSSPLLAGRTRREAPGPRPARWSPDGRCPG